MRKLVRLAAGAGSALVIAAWVPLTAGAEPPGQTGGDHAVFVQTDNLGGNSIVAYARADDGALTSAGTYSTGGIGGQLNGSVVDHLASQGSLTYDPGDALLYAVNAGSNTVSVFSVDGDNLSLRQIVSSGGAFPVSVAVAGKLVYVLNALDGGSVSGYRVAGRKLHPIENSTRALGLAIPTNSSQFTSSPGQVAFSPDGSQLLVTTKGSSNAIDVFGVRPDGRLSFAPVVNTEAAAVPFAVSFDATGSLLVAEAGPNALASFTLGLDGVLTPIDNVATGQAATCWVVPARGFFYTSNAGSPSLTGFSSVDGQLTDLGNTTTDPGTVDASATEFGQFLYVQTGGNGTVDGFTVEPDGSLTPAGSVLVPGAAGGEGIVAF